MIKIFPTPRGYVAQDFEARFASLSAWGDTPEEAREKLNALRASWIDKFCRRRSTYTNHASTELRSRWSTSPPCRPPGFFASGGLTSACRVCTVRLWETKRAPVAAGKVKSLSARISGSYA